MQTSFFTLAGYVWLLAKAVSLAPSQDWSSTFTINSSASSGPSQVQFQSNDYGLDAPHVRPINDTTWDWWYFDAVSADLKNYIVVVFSANPYASSPIASNVGARGDMTVASLALGIGGSPIFLENAGAVPADRATILGAGNGASGLWEGANFSFQGTPDLSHYKLHFDSSVFGIKGKVSLESVAPGHYPCGPAIAGETMEVLPGVGWANAVPDADATVEVSINGTQVKFTGVGYHDKNWGIRPFLTLVGSWYWGRGRLGPYSIVWYDSLTPTGAESLSAYVARDGKIVTAGCSGVTVRPTGANSTYPPHLHTGPPEGFHIEADLGHEGILEVDVSSEWIVANGGAYYRWVGKLGGGLKGQKSLRGIALYEQFALMP